MQRRCAAGIVLVTAMVAISACGSSSSQASRSSTNVFTATGLLAGTARPDLASAGTANQLSVVATGPLTRVANIPGGVFTVILRNRSHQTVVTPNVTAFVTTSAGQVIESGESGNGSTPLTIKPGQLALTEVGVDSTKLPPKAKIRFTPPFIGSPGDAIDLRVDRVGLAPGSRPGDVILTGEATNTSSSNAYQVGPNAYCFTKAGQIQGAESGSPGVGSPTVSAGASTTFTVNTGGPCSTYLVGVNGLTQRP
jgi:hypothetical protein